VTLVSPPMRRHHSPRFSEIGEDDFEDLCREILQAEGDIKSCYRYGTRGHTQFGIDLWAERYDADGIVVAQCKRYTSVSKANLEQWSNDFLEHWPHWQPRGVRRFILYIGCNINTPALVEAIHNERKRFTALGVEYDVLDGQDLTKALAPLPQLVSRFLGPTWVEPLCGVTPPLSIPSPVGTVVISQNLPLDDVLLRLGEHNVATIEAAIETWRCGHRASAVEQLDTLRRDEVQWQSLGVTGQAKLLCTQARLALEAGQFPQARRLQSEAYLLDQTPDIKLEVLLRYHEDGPHAALDWLDTQDTSAPQMRAALELELGDPAAALATLASINTEPDAETLRLQSIAYVAQGNIEAAQSAISESLNRQPQWVSVRYIAAVIAYYETLSPVARPDYIIAWPEPVPWAFLYRDATTITKLEHLASEFAALAQLKEDKETYRRLKLWQAAALLNHPKNQLKAHKLFKELLSDSPPDYRAWLWAFSRNVPVDHRAVVASIGRQIRDGTVSTSEVLALVNYHLTTGALSKARTVLSNTRLLFQQQGANEIWTAWNQAIKAAVNPRLALPGPDPVNATVLQRKATLEALSHRAKESGDFSAMLDYLRGCYTVTGDASFLLWLCEALLFTQGWENLAKHASDLVEHVGTEEAIYLAVVGCFNAGNPYQALSILNKGNALFAQGLPPELERLSIRALQQTGQHQDALKRAEALAQLVPSPENLLTLIDLHNEQGDLSSVAAVAGRLQGSSSLTAEQSLYIAGLLQPHRSQAEIFLRAALTAGLDDDLVGQAMSLAYMLGVPNTDPILNDLMRRLAVLGQQEKANIRIVSVDELRGILIDLHNQDVELTALYRSGRIPLHLLERYYPSIFARTYHSLLDANTTNIESSHQVLYIRHGHRDAPLPVPNDLNGTRLHMDVSALLLAHHFGILPTVEQVFAPIYLPTDLPRTLNGFWANLQPPQPQRLEAQRQIIEAVDRRWVTQIEVSPEDVEKWVLISQTYTDREVWKLDFVTHLPQERSLGMRDVLETLTLSGMLAAEEAKTSLLALGNEGNYKNEIHLPRRTALYCAPGLAEFLAATGLLQAARRYFTLFVPSFDVESMRVGLRESTILQADADWIFALREHITQGLGNATYQLMAPINMPEEIAALPRSSIETSLYLLLTSSYSANDIVWVDDRYVSRYLRSDVAPIVGLLDVATWLKNLNHLAPPQYYNLLYRMRAANLRHIPLMPDEILYYLQNAPLENGQLIETAELRVLRRYYAQGLRTSGSLQPPTPPEQGELAWLMAGHHAIATGLRSLWEQQVPDGEVRAKWILDNLYYETIDIAKLLDIENAAPPTQIAATALLSLVLVHLRVGFESPASVEAYDNWVEHHILTPRFAIDPALQTTVIDAIKNIIEEVVGSMDVPVPRAILMQYCMALLPPSLQTALLEDDPWLDIAEIRKVEQIEVGGARFDVPDFWNALAVARAGGQATLTENYNGRSVTFIPIDEARAGWIFDGSADSPVLIEEAYQALLSPNPADWEECLREHREWFDPNPRVFEEAVAYILAAEEVVSRIQRARQYWEQSAFYFYDYLKKRVREQPLRKEDLLLPDTVLSSLGLSVLPTLFEDRAAYDTTVQVLVESLGIREAIQHLWGFPTPLPHLLLNAVSALDRDARQHLYQDLIRHAYTSVSQLHLLHLLEREEVIALKRHYSHFILQRLMSEKGYHDFVSLVKLIEWVFAHLNRSEWSFHTRLESAWVHAHHLYEILCRSGYNLAKVVRWLHEQEENYLEVFQPSSDIRWDIAHPDFLEPAALLIGGLSSAVAGTNEFEKSKYFGNMPANPIWESNLRNVWFRDMSDLPNFMGTWIGESDLVVWRTLLGNDVVEYLQITREAMNTEAAFEKLSKDPADFQAWLHLGIHRGLMPGPKNWLTPLEKVVTQLDFTTSQDLDQSMTILLVATKLLRGHNDVAAVRHLQVQWEIIVEKLQNQDLTHEKTTNLIALVFQISTLFSTPIDVHRCICECIRRFLNLREHHSYLGRLLQRLRRAFPSPYSSLYDTLLADLYKRPEYLE
jgi:hypothetical protein